MACYTFPVRQGCGSMPSAYPVLLPLCTLLGHLFVQFRNLLNQWLNDNDLTHGILMVSSSLQHQNAFHVFPWSLSHKRIPQLQAPISHNGTIKLKPIQTIMGIGPVVFGWPHCYIRLQISGYGPKIIQDP